MSGDLVGADPSKSTTGEVIGGDQLPMGDWLPPAAAASRLGVSERTLWRLVKAGRYHKRTERGRAEVLVPASAPLPDDSASAGSTGRTVDTGAYAKSGSLTAMPDGLAVAILEELSRQREDDAERLTCQAETIGRLTAELDQARARIADLERPPEPPANPFPQPMPLPPSEASPPPWWRRWWQW